MSIVLFLLILALIISVHEFGHLIVAKLFNIRVLIFSVGFGKRLVGFRFGETDYRISLIPLGGYVKMSGESIKRTTEDAQNKEDKPEESEEDENRKFINKPRWQRMLVIFAGPAMNGVLTIAILSGLLMVSGVPKATHFIVEGIVPDSPAYASGLKIGDKIQEIDETSIEDMAEYTDFAQYIRDNPGNPISFEVLRGDELINIVITPQDRDGQGIIGVEYDIGIGKKRLGPIDSIQKSTSLSAYVVKQTSRGVGDVATGESSPEDTFAGPIRIVSIVGDAAKEGPIAILVLIALLSLSIGLINLVLPIPGLDGGQLYILFAEMVVRKDLSPEIKARLNFIGLLLIVAMITAIIVMDISKITSS